MKLIKPLATAVIVSCFTAVSVFAAPVIPGSEGNGIPTGISGYVLKDRGNTENSNDSLKGENTVKEKDPIKRLQGKKEKVQAAVKEGKIPKEKGEAIITRIDERIKGIEKFNSLPVQQKKQELVNRYRLHIEKKVNEGRLSKEKADELIKQFNAKVEKWDGKGYPDFLGKGSRKHHERRKE